MSDNDRDSELGEESEYWRMLRDLRGGAGRSYPSDEQQPQRDQQPHQPPRQQPDRSTDWYGGQSQGRSPGQSYGQQPAEPDYSWPAEPEWPQRSWERTDLWQRQQPTQEPRAPQPPPPQPPPPSPPPPPAPPPPYEPQPYRSQPDPYQQAFPQQPQQPQQFQSYEQQRYEPRYEQPNYEQPNYGQQRYEQPAYESRSYEQQQPQQQQQQFEAQQYEPEPATFEWSTQHWTDTPFESYAPPLPEVGQPLADEDETSQRYYEEPAGWDRSRDPNTDPAYDPASDRTEEHAFTAFPGTDEATHGDRAEPAPTRHGHRVGAEPEPAWWGGIVDRLRLGPADLEVLGLWVVTRVSLLMISLMAPLVFSGPDGPVGWLDRWRQWDVLHFERIALEGYFGHKDPEEAFFPGLPMLMKLADTVGISTTLIGLLASFVAGGVAAVALSRLAGNEWGEAAGRRAAVIWMVAPPAVFLAAPYTESLFLGFAIPAWLAATKGNWRLVGILAACACLFRISGLFLLIALAVYFVTSRPRQWWDGLWLLLGGIPLGGYMAYLWANTGDPLRWYHAQAENWDRGFTLPHEALIGTIHAATNGFSDLPADQSANFEWMFRAELVAMLVGVVVTVLLLMLRRWAEGTWVGLQVLAFSFSVWFFSVPRATLLWFPLWIGLAVLSVRYKWVWWSYALLAVPLFGVWAAAFLTGKWAG